MGRLPIGLPRCLRVCLACVSLPRAMRPMRSLRPTRTVQRANEELALALQDDGVRDASVDVSLTPRELEVLVLLAEAASNKTIARRLAISVHTAKFHVAAVIDKLDAIGRTDAVAHAARLGIIDL